MVDYIRKAAGRDWRHLGAYAQRLADDDDDDESMFLCSYLKTFFDLTS